MLRAAIVEKSKEHREYIRASLTGINMDIQVSEYADEYDYLDDLNEDASSFDILLLNTTIHREGDGLELAAKKALQQSGKFIPWQVVTVTVDGRLVEE